MHIDRRRSPRIEILGQLHATNVEGGQALTVREISLGGMAIETPGPFEVGSVHTFRLTLGDESTVEMAGRVMHSRRSHAASDAPITFVTGIQFVDDEPAERQSAVGEIIDRVR